MQKRILSLLLVLCMLLPLIPVGVVSVTAAEGEAEPIYTTSLTVAGVAANLPSGSAATVTAANGILPTGWAFVGHRMDAYGTTVAISNYVPNGTANVIFPAGINNWGTLDGSYRPAVFFNDSANAGIHPNMGIHASSTWSGGYAYTAEKSGYITINLTSITAAATTGENKENGGNIQTRAALFVGGKMVWPKQGDFYSNPDNWYAIQTTGNNPDVTVADVYVAEGQAVEFLVCRSWWTAPVSANMTVSYTAYGSRLWREDTSVNASSYKLVLPTGWDAVARGVNNYNNKYSINTVYNKDNNTVSIGFGNEGGWVISPTIGWDASPRLNWTNEYDRSDHHGPYMGLGPNANWNAGYAYVVEHTGYVDINIDALRYYNMEGASSPKYVAVFLDGQMIWPTAGGSYTYASNWVLAENVIAEKTETLYDNSVSHSAVGYAGKAIYAELLTNVYVKEGQTIEFIAKGGIPNDAVQADLSVTYTSLGAIPEGVTADVALGDTFAVTLAPPSGYGLYVNGTKYNVNQTVTLSGIRARDLAQPITYATYRTVSGAEDKSAAVNTSPMQILEKYTTANGYDQKTANLAQAARRYAYAAAAYFDSAAIPAAVQTAIAALAVPTGTASITNSVSETAHFRGINLFVNDPLDAKIFFALDEAPTGTLTLKIEGAVSGTVTTYEKVSEDYVFTVPNIPMKNYGSTLRISLWDGDTQISETLTYGVSIYAARMYGSSDTTFDYLLKTIADLGTAAANYAG